MNERFEEEQKMTEEERAKAAFEDILAEEEGEDEGEQIVLDGEEESADEVDLLDALTGNFDEDEEEAAQDEPERTEKQK